MKSDPVETTAADLCRLLGVPRKTLSDLAKRGILVKGEKRGSYLLQRVSLGIVSTCALTPPSVTIKMLR
jgi:hypothetical protein